jgi:actin-related protein
MYGGAQHHHHQSQVVVLDNGAGTIKLGFGGEPNPAL